MCFNIHWTHTHSALPARRGEVKRLYRDCTRREEAGIRSRFNEISMESIPRHGDRNRFSLMRPSCVSWSDTARDATHEPPSGTELFVADRRQVLSASPVAPRRDSERRGVSLRCRRAVTRNAEALSEGENSLLPARSRGRWFISCLFPRQRFASFYLSAKRTDWSRSAIHWHIGGNLDAPS